MKCKDNDIKGLLPGYIGQKLGQAEAKLVDAHLVLCEDCRSELSLLKLLSMNEVPDPGPAFWAEMPGRVEREVRRQQKRKGYSFRDLAGYLVPRWSWATAAAAMVAVVTLLFLRPIQVDTPQISGHELEYSEPGESVTVAELTPAQLAAASQWTQNQLAPISQAISEDAAQSMERDSLEDLSDLTTEELNRLDKILREREREVKKRIRQKQTNEKNIG